MAYGYRNLSYIIRKQIDDRGYHAIIESIFRIVKPDIAKFRKSTRPTVVAKRLLASASLLRTVVEVGLIKLRIRTVRAILEHVSQCLPTADGGYCEPLVLDYYKAYATLLGHKAHVEHLSTIEWQETVDFCLQCVRNLNTIEPSTPTEPSSRQDSLPSRSRGVGITAASGEIKDSFQSNGSWSFTYPQLQNSSEIIVSCIKCLVSASNAPILCRAKPVLNTLVNLLQTYPHPTKIQQNSYDAVERVLSHTITSDLAISFQTLSQLITSCRKLWKRASPSQRESIIAIFIRCQSLLPYLLEVRAKDDIYLHIGELLEAMQGHYCARKAKEQLTMDDIEFTELAASERLSQSFRIKSATLRSGAIKAEEPWCVLFVIASLHTLLETHTRGRNETLQKEVTRINAKRQKTQSRVQELLQLVKSPQVKERVYALQTIAFLFDVYRMPGDVLHNYLETLASQLSSDDLTTVSWTIFALLRKVPHSTSSEHVRD